MHDVKVGIIGLGNVGTGTVRILTENADQIALKLGFRLELSVVCDRIIDTKPLPEVAPGTHRTANWREVVEDPEIDIVVEVVGGTAVAAEIIEAAIAHGKSVVTANKELMAQRGADLWDRAIKARINLAMEASVAGGIPIHAVLREGISGDRITALFGILNGTSNYILTEIEKHGTGFETVLGEAQRFGYAEADPSADVDGYDARSKLALLAALRSASGSRHPIYTPRAYAGSPGRFPICPSDGIHNPADLLGASDFRGTPAGGTAISDPDLHGSRRRERVPTTPSGCRGATGRTPSITVGGRAPLPTGVAVVSDLMRVAREIRCGSPERVSPFAHETTGRIPADSDHAEPLGILPPFPRGGPARHHRQTGRRTGRPGHQHRTP